MSTDGQVGTSQMRTKGQREKRIIGLRPVRTVFMWRRSRRGRVGWQELLQALGCDNRSAKTRTDLKDCSKLARRVSARECFIHSNKYLTEHLPNARHYARSWGHNCEPRSPPHRSHILVEETDNKQVR